MPRRVAGGIARIDNAGGRARFRVASHELIRHEPFGYVLLLCCGLIPIPLAAAPLAVFVNRHR